MLEQKLAEAKANRHKRFINLIIGFVTISLVSGGVVFYISCCRINSEKAESIFPNLAKKTEKNIVHSARHNPQ